MVMSYTYDIPNLQHIAHLAAQPGCQWLEVRRDHHFPGWFPDLPHRGRRQLDDLQRELAVLQCADRPNQIAPVKLVDPRTNLRRRPPRDSGPSSFATETLGQLGNVSRRAIHALGVNNWDFQFSKDTKITESTTFEMRVELFNMWNHTQFDGTTSGAFGNDILSSTFGDVLAAKPARIGQLAAKFIF